MNLFYKYSHLQRFEQQNEKDGRNEKDDKMRKGEERWEKRDGKKKRKRKRKDFPPGMTIAGSLSPIVA